MAQLAASARGSAQIVLPLFAPVITALLALAALPTLYAATLAPAPAIALVLLHALAMAAPYWLIRKRLLPQDVAAWLRPLPVPPRLRRRADAAVAALVATPLAVLYAVSLAIWLVQRPQWLQPLAGVAATLLSLLLSWAVLAAMLALQARPAGHGTRAHTSAAIEPYTARRARWRGLLLWRLLYWLPLFRLDGGAGPLLALLFGAATASALLWMHPPSGLEPGLLAFATSVLFVLLADRADKARREQFARLQPIVASWPVAPRALALPAQLLAAVPGLLVLAALLLAGAGAGAWQHTAGRLYLALGCATQLVLVAVPLFNARARAGAVFAATLLLTAVGSEIWN